jgi:hypothetical protein
MNKSPATLWQVLEKFPPYYVRILAKKPGSGLRDLGLTDADIAISSGITLSRVREINRSINWHECTVGEVLAFTIACNFDPANPADRSRVAQLQYVCKKRGTKPFQYLRKSPRYESEILPILHLLKNLQAPKSLSTTSVAAR